MGQEQGDALSILSSLRQHYNPDISSQQGNTVLNLAEQIVYATEARDGELPTIRRDSMPSLPQQEDDLEDKYGVVYASFGTFIFVGFVGTITTGNPVVGFLMGAGGAIIANVSGAWTWLR